LKVVAAYEAARDRLARADPPAAVRVAEVAEQADLAFIRGNIGRILARTREGVQRVSRIVQSLRGLARTDRPQLEVVAIPDLVAASLDMLRGRIQRRGIRLELDYGPGARVRCASTQIGQVILNLLLNAVQAIEVTEAGKGDSPRDSRGTVPFSGPAAAGDSTLGALRPNSAEGIEEPVRVIDVIEIGPDLRAQPTPGERVIGVTGDPHSTPVRDVGDDAAGIGAVVRADPAYTHRCHPPPRSEQ
jgi:hypothetical protein